MRTVMEEGRGVDLEVSRRGFGDWSDLERDDGKKEVKDDSEFLAQGCGCHCLRERLTGGERKDLRELMHRRDSILDMVSFKCSEGIQAETSSAVNIWKINVDL